MVETNARSIARVQALMDMRLGAIGDARRRRSDLLAAIPEGPSASRHGGGRARRGGAPAPGRSRRPTARTTPTCAAPAASGRRPRRGATTSSTRFRRRADPAAARAASTPTCATTARRSPRSSRSGRRSQRRVDAAPRWGQELAALSRDYEVLRGRYAARCRAGPTRPRRRRSSRPTSGRCSGWSRRRRCRRARSAPDRPRLLWLAVLAALGLGLAAAGAAEWLDASVRGPEDAGTLGVPVLAAIPRIGPSGRA